MSRHHPNRHSDYMNDYNPYDIDPRNLRDEWVTTDPEKHVSKNSSTSYPFAELPRHERDHRPRLPAPNLDASMPQESWQTRFSPAPFAAMEAESSRQPGRPFDCVEPPIGTSGEAAWKAHYVNPNFPGKLKYEHERGGPEQHHAQSREQYPIQSGEHHYPQPRELHYPQHEEPLYTWWSPREDTKLIEYIKDGKNWSQIGVELGRSADAVRVHWQRHVSRTHAARGVEYKGRRWEV